MSRRQFIATAAALGSSMSIGDSPSRAAKSEVHYDFTQPLEGWETVTGKWAIEQVPGASPGGLALVQRATDNAFNVIVAPGGPYTNLDVSARFKPMSGREDASGGIVFRFSEDRYYVVRANALEDNFNLYYYDRGRRQISSVRVKAPAIGEWHRLRITANGDRIQGWLNHQRLIDQRDSRFISGRIGLWTKADSITAFDDLTITPLNGG